MCRISARVFAVGENGRCAVAVGKEVCKKLACVGCPQDGSLRLFHPGREELHEVAVADIETVAGNAQLTKEVGCAGGIDGDAVHHGISDHGANIVIPREMQKDPMHPCAGSLRNKINSKRILLTNL